MYTIQGFLIRIPGYSPIQPLIESIVAIGDELDQSLKQDSEFSIQNVELPEFSRDDVEMLFGDRQEEIYQSSQFNTSTADNNYVINRICETNKKKVAKIRSLLGAAEILLNEYEEIIKGLSK